MAPGQTRAPARPLDVVLLFEHHQYSAEHCVSTTSTVQSTAVQGRLRALATDAAGELDVLGEDGRALGVNGA